MNPNKKLLVIGFIGGVFLIALILIAFGFTSGSEPQTTNTSSASVTQNGVVIDDIRDYEQRLVTPGIGAKIELALFQQIQADLPNAQGTYKGAVRSSSYTKTADESGTPFYEFLIDFPTIKRTYWISFSGGGNYEQAILHLTCPDSTDLIYPAASCKEPLR
jgi:hypothetical protein